MSLFSKIESIKNTTQLNAALTSILIQYGEELIIESVAQGAQEVSEVATIDNSHGKLSGTYFYINAPGGWEYYVWFNTDYLSIDPLIDSKIGIEVNIPAGLEADGVALALSEALTAEFTTSVVGNVVTITTVDAGSVVDVTDFNTKFIFNTPQQGEDANSQIEYEQVYGAEGNTVDTYEDTFNITGIVVSNDWIPIDNVNAGSFSQGWLYTKDTNIKPGNILRVQRSDSSIRRYVIMEDLALGMNTTIKLRWKLSSLQS